MDLFATPDSMPQPIVDGMFLMRGAADTAALMPLVDAVAARAPFRHLQTPGGGTMSVAMTNCGALGWISDRRGYRYEPRDPLTGAPWPAMPPALHALATACARRCGFPGFVSDVCLINRYVPDSRMGAHQDRDEGDFTQPIVSVSLGLPATFLLYGLTRGGRARRIALADGDVMVFGGPARKVFHGVGTVKPGTHPITGACRVNLTFRRAH